MAATGVRVLETLMPCGGVEPGLVALATARDPEAAGNSAATVALPVAAAEPVLLLPLLVDPQAATQTTSSSAAKHAGRRCIGARPYCGRSVISIPRPITHSAS